MYKNAKIAKCTVIAVVSLAIPVAYVYHVTNSINPYQLTGKQFLAFYGLLTITSLTLAIVWLIVLRIKAGVDKPEPLVDSMPHPVHYMVFILLIGFCRLLQGISHQKPVGYLIILLSLNGLLLLVLRFLNKRV